MVRSRLVHSILECAAQGKSVSAIARELGLARNTVRKYLHGTPPTAAPRRQRPSKLDPFKDQIRQWIGEDRLLNCETIFERIVVLGYTGKRSILRAFVHPLRPTRPAPQAPVRRYETKPGDQLQFDWGEFTYDDAGVTRKLFGFTAILGYSRMRFVTFTKRCDAPTLIRCIMDACEFFGGLPRAMLTDRMKTVLLQMDHRQPVWHPLFGDFMAAIGVTPRVCRAYTPQTKGKVERSVGVIKYGFWPGVRFTDLDDLNRQARLWCEARNHRVHRTTGQPPATRWAEEGLQPLPTGWAWAQWATEERKVSWDGFLSYDGVLYGLPGRAHLSGTLVQVRGTRGQLSVWTGGQCVLTTAQRARSGMIVPHPDQFAGVAPATAHQPPPTPRGHQVPMPPVPARALAEYDRLCGVEVAA